MQSTYQVLSEIEHVRKRPGMYAGSTELKTATEWVYENGLMQQKEISYIPALVKCFCEILDNAIDEGRRAPDVMSSIDVSFSNGYITVTDNGRGIPIQLHAETGKYIPETVFANLRAGSNFDDTQDQSLIGTNGVGSTLVVIFSTEFEIHTYSSGQQYKQVISNGLREIGDPVISNCAKTKHGTSIKFKLDYDYFKISELGQGHELKFIKRVVDAAATNVNLKFTVNGQAIKISSFKDYVSLYNPVNVYDEQGQWSVGISQSEGFEHVSFVNGVETYQGGTHVDYVTNQIVAGLREVLQKKLKRVEIKPADIRSHLRVFVSTNINRPRFSSQTKENMISAVSSYGSSWAVTPKMIKEIVASPILQSVIDWVTAKQQAQELAEMRELNKIASKTKPKNVDKFDDANERTNRFLTELYLVEGDSAKNTVLSARGKDPYVGAFSLRGKLLNVYDADTSDITKNKEIASILTITGLNIGKPAVDVSKPWRKVVVAGETRIVNDADVVLVKDSWVNAATLNNVEPTFTKPSEVEFAEYIDRLGDKVIRVAEIRFGKIVALSDNDLDGFHISSLVMSFFAKYWPELFTYGIIHRMNTPLYIAKTRSDEHEFFTDDDYNAWATKAPKHKAERFKGLGTFDTEVFEQIIKNRSKYLTRITHLNELDLGKLELAFSSDMSDERKTWLEQIRYFTDLDA